MPTVFKTSSHLSKPQIDMNPAMIACYQENNPLRLNHLCANALTEQLTICHKACQKNLNMCKRFNLNFLLSWSWGKK